MAVDRPDDPTTTDLAVTDDGNSPIIIPDAATKPNLTCPATRSTTIGALPR